METKKIVVLEESVKMANKASVLAVTRSGAQSAIPPYRKELILEEIKF